MISAAALVIASLAWLEPWSSPGAFEAQSIGGESYSGEHDALRAEIDALKEQVQSLQEQLWSLQLASKPTSGGREPPVEVEEEPRSFDFGVMAAYDGAREALERCVREAFPWAEPGRPSTSLSR